MTTSEGKHLRAIKSFVLREGRLTPGQKRAFEVHWPNIGIDYKPGALNFSELFGNDNPVFMEIGFGDGGNLASMAKEHPERNYLGIEVHGPGVGHLMNILHEQGSTNVRIMKHDAVEIIDNMLAEQSLDGAYLFFPDPWHKKRHHKRRIVQPEFMNKLARVIKPGGFFHAATDWENYAEHMMEVLSAAPHFDNTAGSGNYTPRPERLLTKFEKRGHRLGHGVWDLIFTRKPD